MKNNLTWGKGKVRPGQNQDLNDLRPWSGYRKASLNIDVPDKSFNGTLKSVYVDRYSFNTHSQDRSVVFEYFERLYNRQRLLTFFSGACVPEDFEKNRILTLLPLH